MKEYIVAFEGAWRHFFIKQHVGLCWRKKEGFKFSDYEVVLKGVCSDFCAYCDGKVIHIACQDEKGSVLYLIYDGISWKKTTLLESKSAGPYKKNFVFLEISGHMNLLYTIENKERLMLVHQVMMEKGIPTVVDYINNTAVPFCVALHPETDFTVFYTNEDNISGYKIYKWSQKAYSDFKATDNGDTEIRFAKADSDGSIMAVATKTTQKIVSLLSICFDENKNISERIPVYLDCVKNITPVISEYEQKQYIVWTEYGGVVAAHRNQDGKWSKPVRYAKSNSKEASLYVICENGKYRYYYGIAREHDIILYGTHDILKMSPGGYDREVYSEKNETYTGEILKKQTEQIKKLYEELSIQRNKLSDLAEKIEEIISAVPIADEEDIDKVLLN